MLFEIKDTFQELPVEVRAWPVAMQHRDLDFLLLIRLLTKALVILLGRNLRSLILRLLLMRLSTTVLIHDCPALLPVEEHTLLICHESFDEQVHIRAGLDKTSNVQLIVVALLDSTNESGLATALPLATAAESAPEGDLQALGE